jgi:hypothetical protein
VRSRRTWVPLLGWLAATLTSIVLASVAMLPVLRTATGGEGGLISADRLRDSGTSGRIPLPPVPSGPSPAPAPGRTPATSPPAGPAPADDPEHSATPSRPPRSSAPATTPPVSEPVSEIVDGWTVTTGGDGVRTFVRSFQVDGGHAVIRAAAGRIELVTATPGNGFEVATVQNSPDNLAVYFNEANHSFIVHVVWNVDRPFAQVDEIGG